MGRENEGAKAFGQRLRDLMVKVGAVSESSRSGVDVAKLAEVASTSYEMARRYAEGLAIPRTDKLAAIAQWLNVPPARLAWGDRGGAEKINERMLESCINAVREAEARLGVDLSPERKAHLIAVLYTETTSEAGMPKGPSLDLMVKAST